MDILWLKQIDKTDLPTAGGKGANLGELFKAGINVPDGFVVTADAYFRFIANNGLGKKISLLLRGLDAENSKLLNRQALLIKKLILANKLSATLKRDILAAYRKMGVGCLVAVRSSATAEDHRKASFGGQQKTFLNVSGEEQLISAVKQGLASLFEPQAIYYRVLHNFDHAKAGIALVVQKMVQAEKSGILFTVNPINNQSDEMLIEAGLGLGEPIVSGAVTPDQYVLKKKTLRLLATKIRPQAWQMKFVSRANAHIGLSPQQKKTAKLTLEEIKGLGRLALKIEKHFKIPQNCEWAIEKGVIFFIQSQPVTAFQKIMPSQYQKNSIEPGGLAKKLLHGIPASLGSASGTVIIIQGSDEIDKVKKGDILVTEMTSPSFIPAMRRCQAIITDTGGATSHAAIIARELGIPAVVGTGQATHRLKNSQIVTVDGAKGVVYQGKINHREIIDHHRQSSRIEPPVKLEIPVTATKIYVNLAEPDLADKIAAMPVDGVGLLRAEFMIANLGKHPQALVKGGKSDQYVRLLEEGMRKIGAAFSPRPVVYRATDFKTNEYRGLTGGKKYEPQEKNPMLGFRGAFRYLARPEMFDLELRALKNVRHKFGLNNLHLMIPFVRTVEELRGTLELVKKQGLKQDKNFKIWMMVEVPSNVILIDRFIAEGIDGVSIGSNDLTQLILGIDRDNNILAREFDERDEAVSVAIKHVLDCCRPKGITTSICGNAPSVYPEITENLVRGGIMSISVAPDMIIPVRQLVASVEKRVLLEKLL